MSEPAEGKTYLVDGPEDLLIMRVFRVNEVLNEGDSGVDVFGNCTLTGDEYGINTADAEFTEVKAGVGLREALEAKHRRL